MILVLVGASRPFDRLVREIDSIAGKIGFEFLIQIGNGSYKPGNCEFFQFKPHEEILRLIGESEFVVCHGGFGSIFNALVQGKPVIAIPKIFELDETDNDQTDLVQFFDERGMVTGVYDIHELEEAIRNSNPRRCQIAPTEAISEAIRRYLKEVFPEVDHSRTGD